MWIEVVRKMIMVCDLAEGYKSQMVKWDIFFLLLIFIHWLPMGLNQRPNPQPIPMERMCYLTLI